MKHAKRLLAFLLSLCILCPAALPSALALETPAARPDTVTVSDTDTDSTASAKELGLEGNPGESGDSTGGTEGAEEGSTLENEKPEEIPAPEEGVQKIQSITMPEHKTVPFGTDKDELQLPETVTAVLENGDTVEIPVSWVDSDYDGEKPGTYKSTAELDEAAMSGYELAGETEITVSVTVEEAEPALFAADDPNAAEFAAIQEKWKAYLVGGLTDTADKDVKAYVDGVAAAAESHYDTMIKAAERTSEPYLLWPELTMNTGYNGAKTYAAKDTSVPARQEFNTVDSAFSRLLDIAEAYSIAGCGDFYQNKDVLNELLAAYDLLTGQYYNEDSVLYGNWYTWEIGIPQSFLKALMILGDDVPADKLAVYLRAIERYVKIDNTKGTTGGSNGGLTAPGTMTGANLLDKAASSAMIAVLKADSERMEKCLADVKTVLKYSNNTNAAINGSDDGFWKDGSYIQHEGIAYNGGYGAVLYQQLGIFLYMFHGSAWDFDGAYQDSPVFDSIFEGVEPLLYNGHFMDMTAGRGITRTTDTDVSRAVGIVAALMPYMDSMPGEAEGTRLKSLLKHHLGLLSKEYFGDGGSSGHIDSAYALVKAKALLEDTSIAAYDGMPIHKSYPSMDKAVHAFSEYAFALSMHSQRIYNHEYINNEGKRTWNISDGMTYLYLDDNQYGDGYWATVDPRRLPGTTTEFVMRRDGVGQDKTNPYSEVGMTEMDGFGVAGMHLKTLGNAGEKNGTEAKKSWFMFGDEIVAVGSGITSNTGNYVETVVENRRIAKDASNTITVNGSARNDLLDGSPEVVTGTANKFVRVRDYDKAAGADSKGQNGQLNVEFGEQQANEFTVEAKLRFVSKNSGENLNFFSMSLRDADDKNVALLYTNSKNLLYREKQDGTSKNTAVGAYSQTGWTKVQLTVNQSAKECTVAWDGETKGTFEWSNLSVNTAPTKVVFSSQGKNNADGDIEVDDIKIYVAGQESSPIVSEDFENFDISSMPSGWSKSDHPESQITVTVENETQNAVVTPKGTKIENVSNIHLAGEPGTGIGYYFPGNPTVKVLKEVRDGDWGDVGPGSGAVSNGYATISIDHGIKPSGEGYAYAILPGKSASGTAAYASSPGFEILSQSGSAHVVKEKTTGITGGFFWEANDTAIANIQVSGPAAVMVKETDDGKLQFAVADPTQKAGKLTVTYTAAVAMGTGNTLGEGVTLAKRAPLTLEINTQDSYGKTFTAILAKDTRGGKIVTDVYKPADIRVETGTTAADLQKALPAKVQAGLSGLTTQEVAVTWSTTGYDGDVNGSYTLAGTLTMPDGLMNPDNLAAEMTVRVGDTSLLDFEDAETGMLPDGWVLGGSGISSDAATSWAKVVQEANGNKVLAVSATTTNKDATASYLLDEPIAGDTLIRYRVQYPNDAQLSPNGLTSLLGFHAYWGSNASAGSADAAVSMMTNTNQQQGHRPGTSANTTVNIYSMALGQWYEVDIRLDTEKNSYSVWIDGNKVVTDAAFRNNKAGSTIGVIRAAAPSGNNGTIYVDDILIRRGAVQKVVSAETVSPITAAFATPLAELGLPETLEVTLEGGKTAKIAVDWDASSYHAGQEGMQTVTGKLHTGGMYDGNGKDAVSVQVTVQPDTATRDILAVGELESVLCALGTAENALVLPASVEVTVTGNVTKTVSISGWSCPAGYRKDTAGEYVFAGTLAAAGNLTNTKGLKAEIHVWVGMDEFDMLRRRWYYQIAGSNDFDENDADVKRYIANLDYYANDAEGDLVDAAKTATTYQQFYDAFAAADMVFKAQPMTSLDKSHSSQVTMTYDRLKRMALGYLTKGGKNYNSEKTMNCILAAMDFMYNTGKYSPGTAKPGGSPSGRAPFGNWYDWEIGTPLRYLDLLVLVYEKLTPEQIENFTGAVKFYTPDPNDGNESGANKIWKCSVAAENAILMKDKALLEKIAPAVKTQLKYVTSGDGFYADGSFIQHTYYSYTGGYGKALLVTLSPVINVLDGTKYAIAYGDGAEQIFYDAVFKSYIPVIINGGVMDMVRCREISRIGGQDHVSGRQMIRAIISMTDVLEGGQKQQALSMVKYYMEQDDRKQIFQDNDVSEFFLEYYISLAHILKGKEILADSSIQAAEPLTGYYNFADMARVVQRLPDHSFGLAMYGGSIYTYEEVNTEGTNMWHTADGMLYLYNTDKEKYADNFWGAVDHQRLPGTTVDRYNKDSKFRRVVSNSSGAAYGGAQIFSKYGATAFQVGNGVSSNKSYFFFDDEAVLLGSGITSTSGNPAETIVENYKAKLDLSNRVSVNGVEQKRTAGTDDFTGKHENVNYIHMEGNVTGSDVGYVFLGGADVTGLRETRTQKWTLMNNYEKFKDDRDVTNSFITMYLEHGANPTDDEYAYIILPGKSEGETAAYSTNADVEILANTKTVQAVREKDLGLTAVNFFAAGDCAAAGVSVDKPASVIYGMDEQGNLTVSVADVTNKASGIITVALNQTPEGTPTGSGITVETGAGSTVLKVDVTGSRGQTRTVTFAKAPGGKAVANVAQLSGISVPFGTAQASLPLPQTVTVTLNDGSTQSVVVSGWASSPAYNGSTAGTYAFTGTLELPAGIINPSGLAASVQVTVLPQGTTGPSVPSGSAGPSSSRPYKPNKGTGTSTETTVTAPANRVTTGKGVNGSYEADVSKAKEGDTVTITARPNTGYEVDEVTVSKQGGGTVPVRDRGDGEYTFEMPGTRVEIDVTFRPAAATPSVAASANYSDVSSGDWFKTAVDYVSAKGMMNGNNGNFMPNTALSRSMIAQILYNLEGGTGASAAAFSDVKAGDWFADAVGWVSAHGVMSGYSSGLFGANDSLTREQLAVTLYQYARVKGYDSTASAGLTAFADGGSVSDWAKPAVQWAAANGLLSGKSGSRLDPQGTATRAEVAAVLMNFIEKTAK